MSAAQSSQHRSLRNRSDRGARRAGLAAGDSRAVRKHDSLAAVRRTMTLVLIGIGVVVLAFAARMYLAGHQTPAGQPALVDLATSSLDSLKTEFNRSSDGGRVILLLSPT
jgi:hypothetical protein